MKKITDNSLWSKLTMAVNAVLVLFFVLSMVFLLKFDKTNVKVVEARPHYEKSFENFTMAQHPLKQDSAEVAYYQYKLDTLQERLATAPKDVKKTMEESISVTKKTLSEKQKKYDDRINAIKEQKAIYVPVKAEWDELNDANAKTKSSFIVMAVITLVVFIVKLFFFATWNYKNSLNIHQAAKWMSKGMPAWMSYVGWIIPVYNLVKPLSFFKEVWQETDYILEDRNIVKIPTEKKEKMVDNSELHIGIWWGLLLISVWLMNFILFKTFFAEGPLFLKANHGNVAVVAIIIMVLCIAEEINLILKYNKKNKMLAANADKLEGGE